MKREITPYKADLMLLIIVVAWGSGYSVTKVAIELTSPIQFLTYRYVISTILALVLFRKKIACADKKDWVAGGAMGVLLMVSMLIQTIGLQYTTAGKAVFLANTFVVMVPFFFWLIAGVKPTFKIIAASLLMLTGLGLLSTGQGGSGGINKGDILVLLSAVSFAMHTAVIGKFAPKRDPFLLSAIQFITAAALFMFIGLFDTKAMEFDPNALWAILYSAIVVTFICTTLQVLAQRFTSPSRAAIIISLESVFGIIIAVLFLQETYTRIMILAFVIIFIAVLVAEVNVVNSSRLKNAKETLMRIGRTLVIFNSKGNKEK